MKHDVTKAVAREHVDDGWCTADVGLPTFNTIVPIDAGKRVIHHNDSHDLPFFLSRNAYRSAMQAVYPAKTVHCALVSGDGRLLEI